MAYALNSKVDLHINITHHCHHHSLSNYDTIPSLFQTWKFISRPTSTIAPFTKCITCTQWRSEGIWRPGANLNFVPPPPQKILKNDNKMSSIQLILCIIISA